MLGIESEFGVERLGIGRTGVARGMIAVMPDHAAPRDDAGGSDHAAGADETVVALEAVSDAEDQAERDQECRDQVPKVNGWHAAQCNNRPPNPQAVAGD